MENLDTKALYEIAGAVAKMAGERLKKINQRRINSDAGNDVKLQEDVESEIFIRQQLEVTNIPVIGEEQGGDATVINSGKPYWVIDPIDGTYNYLRGITGVCVSVGLMSGLKPIVGAIYDFTSDELFQGGKGLPLTLNGEVITPNWAKTTQQGVLMTGFPSATDYSSENLSKFILSAQKYKKVRMCGSACCAMAWVAAGRADAYNEERLFLWDVAAGLSLIESAGGVFEIVQTGFKDNPFNVSIKAAAKPEFFV